jgi:hypothetical protein
VFVKIKPDCHPEGRAFRGPKDLNEQYVLDLLFEILLPSSSDGLRTTAPVIPMCAAAEKVS